MSHEVSPTTADWLSALGVITFFEDCWIWGRAVQSRNYGMVNGTGAHVIAYTLAHGPVPEGKQVNHLCKRKRCINPDHLNALTPRENWEYSRPEYVAAMAIRRAMFEASPVCRNGHSKAEWGTTSTQGFVCRKCRNEAADRHRAKRALLST